MPNYDTTMHEILGVFKRAIKYGDEVNATTGRYNDDGTWTIFDETIGLNRIYVTIEATRQVILVQNSLGITTYNVPVILDKDKKGDWRMVGIDMVRGQAIFGSGLLAVAQPPIIDGLTQIVLSGSSLRDGRLRKSTVGDLYVYLEPFVVVKPDGTLAEVGGEDIDVSSYLPASSDEWELAVIGVDTTSEAVVVAETTPQDTSLPLERSDALAVTYPGVAWQGAVKLRNGQTAVPQAIDDFIDLRAHFENGPRLHNLSASAAPTVNDDVDSGYQLGSIWVDTSNGNLYICRDNTDGAAVWVEITDTFLGLADTPTAYSGQGGKLAAVNSGATAIEFIDPATVRIFERSTADVSTPPTDAELDAAFGTPATVGDGFVAFVDDNDADTAVYLVMSNGTSWWFTSMTKAT